MIEVMGNKSLGRSTQLAYQSNDELVKAVNDLVQRMRGRRKYLNKLVYAYHVVNAMVLWLSRHSQDEQDEFIDRALDALQDYEMGKEISPLGGSLGSTEDVPARPRFKGAGSVDVTPKRRIKSESK